MVATTLNSAEVFDPSTQTWSAAANAMGVKRAGVATLFEAGSVAGEAILPGGVDVEAGTLPSTCAGTASIKQAAQSETDLYDPGTEWAARSPRPARSTRLVMAPARVLLERAPTPTDLLIVGGACTTASPSLQSCADRHLAGGDYLRQRERAERLLGAVQPVDRAWTRGSDLRQRLHADQRAGVGSASVVRPFVAGKRRCRPRKGAASLHLDAVSGWR